MKRLIPLLFLIGCGQQCPKGQTCQAETATPAQPAPTATPAPQTTPVAFSVAGNVVGEFAVQVDGKPYADLEAYWTAEQDGLAAQVAAAGYPGYQARLDAQIGFQDLYEDMTVYVQSTGPRGYAGRTTVAVDGTWSLTLPADAADSYAIRANKRIGVTLTKGQTTKQICYNFSAVAQSVAYTKDVRPVRLDQFQTELTGYDCSQPVDSQGLQIPGRTNPLTGFLKPGLTYADVAYAFGPPSMTIRQNGQERDTWYVSTGLCQGSTDCTVTFAAQSGDGSGGGLVVTGQTGVKVAYLDPTANWLSQQADSGTAQVSGGTADKTP